MHFSPSLRKKNSTLTTPAKFIASSTSCFSSSLQSPERRQEESDERKLIISSFPSTPSKTSHSLKKFGDEEKKIDKKFEGKFWEFWEFWFFELFKLKFLLKPKIFVKFEFSGKFCAFLFFFFCFFFASNTFKHISLSFHKISLSILFIMSSSSSSSFFFLASFFFLRFFFSFLRLSIFAAFFTFFKFFKFF